MVVYPVRVVVGAVVVGAGVRRGQLNIAACPAVVIAVRVLRKKADVASSSLLEIAEVLRRDKMYIGAYSALVMGVEVWRGELNNPDHPSILIFALGMCWEISKSYVHAAFEIAVVVWRDKMDPPAHPAAVVGEGPQAG